MLHTKILSEGLERWQQLSADTVLGSTSAPFPAPVPPRHNKPGTPAPEHASPSSGAQKNIK